MYIGAGYLYMFWLLYEYCTASDLLSCIKWALLNKPWEPQEWVESYLVFLRDQCVRPLWGWNHYPALYLTFSKTLFIKTQSRLVVLSNTVLQLPQCLHENLPVQYISSIIIHVLSIPRLLLRSFHHQINSCSLNTADRTSSRSIIRSRSCNLWKQSPYFYPSPRTIIRPVLQRTQTHILDRFLWLLLQRSWEIESVSSTTTVFIAHNLNCPEIPTVRQVSADSRGNTWTIEISQ